MNEANDIMDMIDEYAAKCVELQGQDGIEQIRKMRRAIQEKLDALRTISIDRKNGIGVLPWS